MTIAKMLYLILRDDGNSVAQSIFKVAMNRMFGYGCMLRPSWKLGEKTGLRTLDRRSGK